MMIENVISDNTPWVLGSLEEGWEWIAFTFHDQLPIELNDVEINKLLEASDKVVQTAYKRMDLSDLHQWTKNTDAEVEFIIKECNLGRNDLLIDFGCGFGRHSIGLAQKGINVKAVDYIDSNINAANKAKVAAGCDNVDFILDDCREVKLSKAKAVICLYDVIGSYADNNENIKILKNIADNLEDGGVAIISVMNYELTEAQAKHRFSISKNPNELLNLRPSSIMETTGNVFDPDYYAIDEETKIVYRREQFKRGKALPIELIVRDKRFTRIEIEEMCRDVGLSVIYSRYVNAKDWESGFNSTAKSAKEILVKCVKN